MRRTLDRYVEERLRRGLRYLVKSEAMAELALSPTAFNAAVSRLARKSRVARLRKGFVLILRPEDYWASGPEASRWIDPFMRHLGIDYRISLLSAAQFHGSAHQAPQEFQVIAQAASSPCPRSSAGAFCVPGPAHLQRSEPGSVGRPVED